MKKHGTIITAVLMAALLFSCAKEQQQQTAPMGEEFVVPTLADCDAPLYMNGQGEIVPMMPAEIPDEIKARAMATKAEGQTYKIPVVFHIFGASQGSGPLTLERMQRVLDWINNDYNMVVNTGDAETFNTINEERKQYSAALNTEFVLGKYHPDGTRLAQGVIINEGEVLGNGSVVLYPENHPVTVAGPGNSTSSAMKEIRKIAWDCDIYMNVYICKSIFADGKTNRSGIAFYPDNMMTSQNTARVVYNGLFLPGGSYFKPDFTSVISHEFGHFLNLRHTFRDEETCGTDGNLSDYVDDTPECEYPNESTGWYWGHNYKNCHGEFIDHGNFMNYGVYCHFTQGQVARMQEALELKSRACLWDPENLKIALEGIDLPYSNPSSVNDKMKYIEREITKDL